MWRRLGGSLHNAAHPFHHWPGRALSSSAIRSQRDLEVASEDISNSPLFGAKGADEHDMSPGDAAVHLDFGLCRFDGLVTGASIDSDERLDSRSSAHIRRVSDPVGASEDFDGDAIQITFRNHRMWIPPLAASRLYKRIVPSNNGDLPLSTYSSRSQATWLRKREQLFEKFLTVSLPLHKAYTERKNARGKDVTIDFPAYEAFVSSFPHTLTSSQEDVEQEVLSDLQSGRPMNRLLIGDVGYGKTEIALRVAFAAATSRQKLQTAILVPTTLLAKQHYETFSKRMEEFGVRVGVLSRMTEKSREVLQRLERGDLDVIIGTHALLGKQVRFRRLGLVVIDEEHRFGVRQKETFRRIDPTVHELSMSATPLPRTLSLLTLGVRDVSTLSVAPATRMNVETQVEVLTNDVIREAIARERRRNGQILYIVPRIARIATYVDKLRSILSGNASSEKNSSSANRLSNGFVETADVDGELCSSAKIAVLNGQMPAAEMQRTIADFYDGKIDILVATNIVDAGLHIPTCNTLIVTDAHLLGMGQLHQLRGRVGRSGRAGHVLLTYPLRASLSPSWPAALRRLRSLQTLAGGLDVARRDALIRGGGDLAGYEQSGGSSSASSTTVSSATPSGWTFAVPFVEMLEESLRAMETFPQATAAKTVESVMAEVHRRLQDPILAGDLWYQSIPPSYIADRTERWMVYRATSNPQLSPTSIADIRNLLTDMYGEVPDTVDGFLTLAELKRVARKCCVRMIHSPGDGFIYVYFKDIRTHLAVPDIKAFLGRHRDTVAHERDVPDFLTSPSASYTAGYISVSESPSLRTDRLRFDAGAWDERDIAELLGVLAGERRAADIQM